MPFVIACFRATPAPRPENSDSDEKDALFGLDTQITILKLKHNKKHVFLLIFLFIRYVLMTLLCFTQLRK
jgi:hypothetical protein